MLPLWPDFQRLTLLRTGWEPVEFRHGEIPLPNDAGGRAGEAPVRLPVPGARFFRPPGLTAGGSDKATRGAAYAVYGLTAMLSFASRYCASRSVFTSKSRMCSSAGDQR